MKMWKKIFLIFLVLGILSIGFLTWYRFRYSMEFAPSFEVNSNKLNTKILIATQGSEFKNSVVQEVVDKLRPKPVYIKAIDISVLSAVQEREWSAIVILHTWEYSKPPEEVEDFINRLSTTDNIITVTTSGSGTEILKPVDGISSASKLTEVSTVSETIITKLEEIMPVLNNRNENP